MNQVVRRALQAPTLTESGEELFVKRYRSECIFVDRRLSLGIDPKIHLSWAVVPRHWAKNCALMVFRSTTGFCPEKYPDDLNRHGQLVVEANHDASYEEHLPEGTHYYTFLLHRPSFLGLWEKVAVLRFSETIPSAKVAIGRITDRMELQRLMRQHELEPIEHDGRLNEARLRLTQSRKKLEQSEHQSPSKAKAVSATDAVIAERIEDIDALVATLAAEETKVEELKRDPRFRKLSPKARKRVLAAVKEKLDAAEVSVRREQRET